MVGITIDLRPQTPDLRKVKVGTVVISTKGFKFKLVKRVKGKESWKDLTTGIVWHDTEDKKYTHYQAVEKFKDKLPTIEEFETAEKHGFREVLPNTDHWFWSASLYPDDTDYARGFDGYSGNSGFGFRDDYFSVRCVTRE